MNSGILKQVKLYFPEACDEFLQQSIERPFEIGDIYRWNGKHQDLVLICINNNFDDEYTIIRALRTAERLADYFLENPVESLAIPLIGYSRELTLNRKILSSFFKKKA